MSHLHPLTHIRLSVIDCEGFFHYLSQGFCAVFPRLRTDTSHLNELATQLSSAKLTVHCKKNAPVILVTRPATWSLCLHGQGVWIRALTGECYGNFSHMVERRKIDTCILRAQLPQMMCCCPLKANNKLVVLTWAEYVTKINIYCKIKYFIHTSYVILFKPAVQSYTSLCLDCLILMKFTRNVDMVQEKDD